MKGAAITLGILLGIGLVGVAALQIRLSKGPIEIPQLVAPIERGLSDELGNSKVRIGAVQLYRSEQTGRIEIRLDNLRLVNQQGATVARVPTAAIDISRNALLLGSIAPKSIELIRPRLVLSYDNSAGISLRFAGFLRPALQTVGGEQVTATEIGTPATDMNGLAALAGGESEAVSLVQVLKDTFRAARERRASTSFLKRVGIRDAVIVLRTKTHQTVWTAPRLGLELRHHSSRSVIRGSGTLANRSTPWEFAFEIDDTPARGAFKVRTLFRDLIPGELGRAIPVLGYLNALETPLSGHADFHLAQDGTLASAAADIVVGAGIVTSGSSGEDAGAKLDEGHIKLDYRSATRQVRIEKMDLLTARGRLVLAGAISLPPIAGADNRWDFDLRGKLRFTPATPGEAAPLSDIAFAGSSDPATGSIRVDRFNVSWPEGQIAGRGQITESGGMTLSGQIGEMSKAGLLQAWPPFAAIDAREWIVKNVTAEQITGGQFSLSLPSDFRERLRTGGDIPAEAVSLDVAVAGLDVVYIDGVPPIRLPAATVSIRGRGFRVKAPSGFTTLPSGKRLAFEQSDLVVRDLRPDRPDAQIFMKLKGDANAVVEYLQLKGLGYLESGTQHRSFNGKAAGTLRIRFPMRSDLDKSHVRLNGKISLTDGAAKDVFGDLDLAGGSIVFDLTEKAVEANGDILVNGVPAKVRWLRLLEGAEDKQPPLRISARLDASDRTQVGLNINHVVDGVIAVDVAIVPQADAAPAITVQADLTQASVGLDFLSWRKAIGKSALVQFDVVSKKRGISELQNFKVVGDNIAIDGWIELGPDNRVRRFELPEFSVDVITRMELSGALNSNDVWDVKVNAASFDARPLFRNLFAPKRFSRYVAPKRTRRSGLIIRAFVKSMVGFSDTSLTDAQIVLRRRGGKIIGLEASGALESGAPIAVSLKKNSLNRRVLYAETRDAGSAFRLTGFYKNIRRGEAKLQVNLDDPGVPDISGVLWTRNFYMLGDPVVSEVLRSGGKKNDDGPVLGIRTQRGAGGQKRTVIEFDQLRFNFSVGNGQFVLRKSFINGPALGATLRGKVDFERRRIDLGGTYVPLYGLNSALGSLPLLGPIFVGELGEGVLGITFAIQGRLDKPNVLVNPVSLVAPGIFRKIFEISPSEQRITPRRKSGGRRKAGTPKSSSAPAYSPSSGKNSSSWPNANNN